MSKAERTSLFILEKVAPIFNKKGYAATSMADITEATGLTKGAIYGNFESKEKLALAAFNYNFKKIVQQLNERVLQQTSGLMKLKAITTYYREYYAKVIDVGGCPIVNIGVDSNYQNPLLFDRARQIMERMIEKMKLIIDLGKEQGEIKQDADSKHYAQLIFAQIEGGIFTSVISRDPACVNAMLDHVDNMIEKELRT